MQIDLQEPFKSLYRKGYLRESADGRRRVDLYNSPEDRTTISYARYLLSVKNGRFLNQDEEADHIDTDTLHDDLKNLQVLTKAEHAHKTALENFGKQFANLVCPQCGKTFTREKRFVRTDNPKCSRRCNALSNSAFTALHQGSL